MHFDKVWKKVVTDTQLKQSSKHSLYKLNVHLNEKWRRSKSTASLRFLFDLVSLLPRALASKKKCAECITLPVKKSWELEIHPFFQWYFPIFNLEPTRKKGANTLSINVIIIIPFKSIRFLWVVVMMINEVIVILD